MKKELTGNFFNREDFIDEGVIHPGWGIDVELEMRVSFSAPQTGRFRSRSRAAGDESGRGQRVPKSAARPT